MLYCVSQELNLIDLDADLSVWRMKVLAVQSLLLHGAQGPWQHGMASRVFLCEFNQFKDRQGKPHS